MVGLKVTIGDGWRAKGHFDRTTIGGSIVGFEVTIGDGWRAAGHPLHHTVWRGRLGPPAVRPAPCCRRPVECRPAPGDGASEGRGTALGRRA